MQHSHYRKFLITNEKRSSSDPEIASLIRQARATHNLPNAMNDYNLARKKVSTKRQIRRSMNNYRDSIRYMNID